MGLSYPDRVDAKGDPNLIRRFRIPAGKGEIDEPSDRPQLPGFLQCLKPLDLMTGRRPSRQNKIDRAGYLEARFQKLEQRELTLGEAVELDVTG